MLYSIDSYSLSLKVLHWSSHCLHVVISYMYFLAPSSFFSVRFFNVISFFKKFMKIIKEWNAELQERTEKFRKQAAAIAEWDKRILHNRDVLLRLDVS